MKKKILVLSILSLLLTSCSIQKARSNISMDKKTYNNSIISQTDISKDSTINDNVIKNNDDISYEIDVLIRISKIKDTMTVDQLDEILKTKSSDVGFGLFVLLYKFDNGWELLIAGVPLEWQSATLKLNQNDAINIDIKSKINQA